MDNINLTNKEIWIFLKNKMRKNGLTSNIYSCTKVDDNGFPCFFLEEAYKNNDVHNAIAIAYRSGYERAIKGRPFKIGEKKKRGGHWEPIDIKDVPKGECKIVEDCLGWHYEYLGTYKKGEDGKFYQWVEDDE